MFKVGQRVKAHLGENFMAKGVQEICVDKVGVIIRVLRNQDVQYYVEFENGTRIYMYADEVSPVGAKVV